MSYQGGEYIPGSYDNNDSQAFDDIVSASEFSDIVTPELVSLEKLRSDFRNSHLDMCNYADNIKLRPTIDNINKFPEIGEKNIRLFYKYVSYMMRSDEESDMSVAANLTTSLIEENARMLSSRTFGNVEYLEPSVDDVRESIIISRGYDEADNSRISTGSSSVYAEFLSHNMSMYVDYITRNFGVKGEFMSKKGRERMSKIQKGLSRLGIGMAAGYMIVKKFKKRQQGD